MPKEHRRNIFAYCAFSLLVGFYIASSTTVLFERQLGLSFSQIFTLDAVYMLMFILFTVPAGGLADQLGRKRVLVLGALALVVAALASGSAHSYLQLFLSYFIWAFGFSLITGASDAMLYDTLNNGDLYQKVYGRAASLGIIGMAISSGIGPVLYGIYFRLPYLLSALPFLLAAVAIFFFREAKGEKKQFTFKKYFAQIKDGTKLTFNNKFILWSTAVLSIVFAVSYSFTSIYQPYLVDIGFAVSAFSFIVPAMFVIEALGGAWSEPITKWFGESASFWINFVTVGVSLLVLGVFANKAALPALFIYSFVQGVLKPFLSTYTNRYIESSHRATVISVQGMFGTIVASSVLFAFGFLTDKIGVIALAQVVGASVLILGTLLLAFRPRSPKQAAQ